MNSSLPLTNQRGAAFTRLASRVLEALNEAIDHRREEGQTLTQIADRLGYNRSVLSRVLNGTSSNLTLRTISDVLWAANYDPQDFKADPIEKICPNWVNTEDSEADYVSSVVFYPTKTLKMESAEISQISLGSAYRKPQWRITLQ
jgi:transcriptional regulator with XRE-family HTH domain